MGFYDRQIKLLCESCPRLVIFTLNSLFAREHRLDAEVRFLDCGQVFGGENEDYMDMLLEVDGHRYHLEFQLLDDNMAIRMYEYCVRDTLQQLAGCGYDGDGRYDLRIMMPVQAVVYLAGANKKDWISVLLVLPDGSEVSYGLPCVSASRSVESLIANRLYLLIPFQQVQFNDRMNHIRVRSKAAKVKMAKELFSFHIEVKNSLDELLDDDILTLEEHAALIRCFGDIEQYLAEKDQIVQKEVAEMGDPDYVSWSERAEAIGEKNKALEIAKNLKKAGMSVSGIADATGLSVEEIEEL